MFYHHKLIALSVFGIFFSLFFIVLGKDVGVFEMTTFKHITLSSFLVCFFSIFMFAVIKEEGEIK